jgi:hypothetical protein
MGWAIDHSVLHDFGESRPEATSAFAGTWNAVRWVCGANNFGGECLNSLTRTLATCIDQGVHKLERVRLDPDRSHQIAVKRLKRHHQSSK